MPTSQKVNLFGKEAVAHVVKMRLNWIGVSLPIHYDWCPYKKNKKEGSETQGKCHLIRRAGCSYKSRNVEDEDQTARGWERLQKILHNSPQKKPTLPTP